MPGRRRGRNRGKPPRGRAAGAGAADAHRIAPSGRGGWLRALVDPQLSVALQRLHEQPEAPWTVDGLARTAAMSRSVFAVRFKTVVGEGPLTYLTRWRMHRAAQLLASGVHSMSEVAQSVGYETDSAFAKAFKRHVGATPGAFRRETKLAAAQAGVEARSGNLTSGPTR